MPFCQNSRLGSPDNTCIELAKRSAVIDMSCKVYRRFVGNYDRRPVLGNDHFTRRENVGRGSN